MRILSIIIGLALLQPGVEEDPFAPTEPPASPRPTTPVQPDDDTTPQPKSADADPVTVALQPDALPILRVNPKGPRSRNASVVFSPDGKTLYAAGSDKVVHVWRFGRTPNDEYHDRPPHFIPAPEQTLRVPVGPGLWGTINSMALSDDGVWLAVGGWGWAHGKGVADFRDEGFLWPSTAFFPSTLEDIGTIYVFNIKQGNVVPLRGHQGPVIGLAFADGDPTKLISIGIDQPPDGTVKGTVRAWDVATGKQIGRIALPKEPGERYSPSLTAWRLPDGGLRAVFTWLDGWVRVWDVGKGQPNGFDVGLSLVCERRPGTDEVVFGEFAAGQNQLTQRLLPAERPQWRRIRGMIGFGEKSAPVAAAFVASRASQPIDHLALAVADATPTGPKYRLELRRIADGRTAGPSIDLPFAATPDLAAASTGMLAAASEPDGSILLFDVARWIGGDRRPAERLAGAGLDFEAATWVRKQDHRGLRIDSDRVLDLTASEVVSGAGWQPDAAAPAGWTVRRQNAANESRLSIGAPDGRRATVVVPVRCDAYAICPTVPGVDRAILAAAATGAEDSGWLSLFDARTGERLRKLTGHTGPVSSLSFSADGRLLLSAASDRTLNVWWLGDLNELVGQRGLFRGLSVESQDGSLVVKELTSEASDELRRGLPVGTVIRGLRTPGGDLRTFDTAGKFYRYVTDLTPGSRITFRTNRGDVAVTVGQAIDERKPLFSLFFERDPNTGGLSWIGWSPFGPFESSDRLIERWVGWHFNPQRPEDRVRFADLGEYRESFFGRGLLDELIRTGRIPAEWPPVDAKVSALIRNASGDPLLPDAAGRVELEAAPSELIVEVAGVPAGRVSRVEWSLPGEQPVPLVPSSADRGVWTADLDGVDFAQGERAIEVNVAGDGFTPVTTQLRLQVRRAAATAPRPVELPRVAIVSPSPNAVIEEDAATPGRASVRVEAQIAAWEGAGRLTGEFLAEGEPVMIDGEPLRVAAEPTAKPMTLSATIPLKPGRNRIGVRLRDDAGTIGPEQAVLVQFVRPPVVLAVDGPAEVDGDTATITARVRSPIELDTASVRVAVNGVPVTSPAAMIAPGEGDDVWSIRVEEIPLAGPSNEITFQISNDDGPERTPGQVRIARVSPAPKPVIVQFANLANQSVVSTQQIPVTAIVRSGSRLQRAELYVNGNPVTLTVPEADGEEYRFQHTATLDRSISTLRLVATAADGGIGQAEATLTVITRPVSIEIDRIVDANGKAMIPRIRGDGSIGVEDTVATDTATVSGRIVWSSAADLPNSGDVYVHSWVNGFLQSSRRVAVAGRGLEQAFEIDLTLNRRVGNRIRLELPGLAEDDGGRGYLVLDCSDPDARQRVHLLLAGVGLPDAEGEKLRERVIDVLQSGDNEAAGSELVMYRPLVGDVYAGDILGQLQLFRHRAPEPGTAHDVLLLYFYGEEAAQEGGHFVLVTDDSSSNPAADESAVTSRRLSNLLEETRGAHLVFLDVAPFRKAPAATPPTWPRDSHLGVVRSVWLGDGTTPAEYSIWSGLKQVSSTDRRLGPIADSLAKMHRERSDLVIDQYVPPDLSDLVLLGYRGE